MIDSKDVQIINALLENSRARITNISKHLDISNVAIQQRIQKLEEEGVIKAYTAQIDLLKMGFRTTAYLGIYLEKAKHYHEVIAQIRNVPYVLEAHFTTGTYSIFAKIFAKDNRHLMSILSNQIQNIDGIARTETFISLEEGVATKLSFKDEDVLQQ